MSETGRRLLEAATAAFAAKGFHGTTTRDIATGAGVTPGAVYVHHRSKEELLFQISRHGHAATLDLLRSTLEQAPDDPVEQLRALMFEFARWEAVHHTTARIVNYELQALSPEHLADVMALRQDLRLLVRELVERGQAAGVFTVSDAGLAVVTLISLCIDIARWFSDDGEWTAEQVAAGVSEAGLRLVGAVPTPR